MPDRRISKSPKPFTPLDSRRIANIVIAKNLNQASSQVQVQALEVIAPSHIAMLKADVFLAYARETQFHENSRTRCPKTISFHRSQCQRYTAFDNAFGISDQTAFAYTALLIPSRMISFSSRTNIGLKMDC